MFTLFKNCSSIELLFNCIIERKKSCQELENLTTDKFTVFLHTFGFHVRRVSARMDGFCPQFQQRMEFRTCFRPGRQPHPREANVPGYEHPDPEKCGRRENAPSKRKNLNLEIIHCYNHKIFIQYVSYLEKIICNSKHYDDIKGNYVE